MMDFLAQTTQMLDRLLDPVGRALGPEAARRLIDIRADSEVQRRIDDLANRANEGRLTPDERGEYELLIMAATMLAILQAKARQL